MCAEKGIQPAVEDLHTAQGDRDAAVRGSGLIEFAGRAECTQQKRVRGPERAGQNDGRRREKHKRRCAGSAGARFILSAVCGGKQDASACPDPEPGRKNHGGDRPEQVDGRKSGVAETAADEKAVDNDKKAHQKLRCHRGQHIPEKGSGIRTVMHGGIPLFLWL